MKYSVPDHLKKLFGLFLFVLALGACQSSNKPRSVERMNVLLITTDQQRADYLGFAGHPLLKTPNLDHLAETGVFMERAYCTTPLCVPSRTTVFTAQYAARHETSYVNKITLNHTQKHLAGILKQHGYELALVGKNHVFTDEYVRDSFDFKELFDLRGKEDLDFCSPLTESDKLIRTWRSNTDIVPIQEGVVWEPQPGKIEDDPNVRQTEYALEFLTKRNRNSPFFMYLSFESPHFPYVVPEPYFSMYDLKQLPDPPDITEGLKDKPFRLWMQYYGQNFHNLSKEDIKRVVASYMAQITLVDSQIGHVVNFLRESGEIENTIIVFISDHGDFAGNHGMIGKTNALYEDLLRVPMIFSIPGLKGGGKISALTELTDVAPTILEILGIPLPASMEQGKSMLDLMKGKTDEHRSRIVAEGHLRPGNEPGHGLTVAQFKEEIRNAKPGNENRHLLQLQQTMLRSLILTDGMKLILNENEIPELYNLIVDPGETKNLYRDPDYQDILTSMIKELESIDLK